MIKDFEIIFRNDEKRICVHSSGVIHSTDISCSVAELKKWIRDQITSDESRGVLL